MEPDEQTLKIGGLIDDLEAKFRGYSLCVKPRLKVCVNSVLIQ